MPDNKTKKQPVHHKGAKPPKKRKPILMAKGGRPAKARRAKLNGISDIRRYFYRNTDPIFFISATNFNLLNIDEWVDHFYFINYIDCFDGKHPRAFIPNEVPHEPFESIEDINNYLLQHKEVIDFIRSKGKNGKAVFLFFDEKTEELCKELGLEIMFPSFELRNYVDDKINTVKIGNDGGVPSAPNVLTKVESYEQLRSVTADLGNDLVIQTAYGDSGHTTFFISSEKDYNKHADEITAEEEVKVMKKINCLGTAIEACATKHGTIVGPLMTELVGFPELTPYKGGWCGNEVFAGAFTKKIRQQATEMTYKFGEELRKLGYRGYFELDILIDKDSGELYLGEVNPRITGASSMTNLSSFAHADAPLFLFHLLEFADLDYKLDVAELNNRWSDPDNIDAWSQLVIKYVGNDVRYIEEAPPSGVWRLREDYSAIDFTRVQTHRRTVRGEREAFFLRIASPGSYLYEGADIGILISPKRMMDDKFKLTRRAKSWIKGIHSQFVSRSVKPAEVEKANEIIEVGGFKLL